MNMKRFAASADRNSAKAYQRGPEILKKAWSVGLFW